MAIFLAGCGANKNKSDDTSSFWRSLKAWVQTKVHPRPATPSSVSHLPSPTPALSSPTSTPPPLAKQQATPVPALYLAAQWQVQEAQAWKGTWIRQGDSNTFEITNQNQHNGITERFTVEMSFRGTQIEGRRSDGVNYQGTLSSDFNTIRGIVWNHRGDKGEWLVDIVPSPSASSTPPPPTLTPEGLYYLLKSIHVTTDSGVMGIHPGTLLMQIGEQNGKIVVTDGTVEFSVSPTDITNHIEAARTAFANDRTAQQLLALSAQEADQLSSRKIKERALDNERKLASIPRPIRKPSALSEGSRPVNYRTYSGKKYPVSSLSVDPVSTYRQGHVEQRLERIERKLDFQNNASVLSDK